MLANPKNYDLVDRAADDSDRYCSFEDWHTSLGEFDGRCLDVE